MQASIFTDAAGTNLSYSVTDANTCTAATGTFNVVEPAAITVSDVSQSSRYHVMVAQPQ